MTVLRWSVAVGSVLLALSGGCSGGPPRADGSDSGAGPAQTRAPHASNRGADGGGADAVGLGVMDGGSLTPTGDDGSSPTDSAASTDGAGAPATAADSGVNRATCAMGLTPCAGACLDLATDDANCGACGKTCGAGTGCFAKACGNPAAPSNMSPRNAPGAATGPDGKIYIIGGSGNASVMAFDPATNTWSSPPDMPTARGFIGAATDKNGLIYALAGVSNQGSAANEVYDVTTSKWTTKAPLPAWNTWASAATGGDGKVYLLGFANNTSPASVTAYTPATDTWASVAVPTTGACALAAGTDGRIYAAGGVDEQGMNTSTLKIFDTTTGIWSSGASLDAVRRFNVAAPLLDGRILVAMGDVGPSQNPQTPSASVRIYNPTTDAWSAGPDAPAALTYAAASTGRDGRVYVAGGKVMNTATNTALYVFNPRADAWVSSN